MSSLGPAGFLKTMHKLGTLVVIQASQGNLDVLVKRLFPYVTNGKWSCEHTSIVIVGDLTDPKLPGFESPWSSGLSTTQHIDACVAIVKLLLYLADTAVPLHNALVVCPGPGTLEHLTHPQQVLHKAVADIHDAKQVLKWRQFMNRYLLPFLAKHSRCIARWGTVYISYGPLTEEWYNDFVKHYSHERKALRTQFIQTVNKLWMAAVSTVRYPMDLRHDHVMVPFLGSPIQSVLTSSISSHLDSHSRFFRDKIHASDMSGWPHRFITSRVYNHDQLREYQPDLRFSMMNDTVLFIEDDYPKWTALGLEVPCQLSMFQELSDAAHPDTIPPFYRMNDMVFA